MAGVAPNPHHASLGTVAHNATVTGTAGGVLSLVALEPAAAARLRSGTRLVQRPWTDTRELADPMALGQELAREAFDAVFVEADFILPETMSAAPRLRYVGVCRGDYGHVDVAAATTAGVVVAHTPARNAAAVAELTVGLMLALLRRIPAAVHYVAAGAWQDPVAAYSEFRGQELGSQTVGIVGLGAIGRQTAALLRPFGATLVASDPALPPDHIRAAGCEPLTLDALLERATIVAVHCPSNSATRGLIGDAAIGHMPRGARLVVTTGEGVVDEHDVAAALRAGQLAGAAFDVFDTHPIRPDHPLLGAPNVLLLPHMGGATDETVRRYSRTIVDDYLRFARGERPAHLVNPEVWDHRR